MNEYLERDWAGAAQIFMIKRTVKEKDEERLEIVYGITNAACEKRQMPSEFWN